MKRNRAEGVNEAKPLEQTTQLMLSNGCNIAIGLYLGINYHEE